MSAPQAILHIGAPKCGSSALQMALTRHPELRDAEGRRLRYAVPLRGKLGKYSLSGRAVARLSRASAYGYVSWPNFGRRVDPAPIRAALEKVLLAGGQGGWVPILSSEGWINHPEIFADILARLGHPPVDVVCFLRPPAEWLNAAWWQWGIWTVGSVDRWTERGFMHYGFAQHLSKWAEIPGVCLQVQRSRPDAVARFAKLYGCDLPAGVSGNASSPPSLIGFLLRNRRFRPGPHDAQAEFIFQRWCPSVPSRPLWALEPRHIRALRPATRQSRDALQRILPPEDYADLLEDRRWIDEKAYHAAILEGLSTLRDPSELPALHDALARGVRTAAQATRRRPPELPRPLSDTDPVEDWDPLLAEMLDHLMALDHRYRTSPLSHLMQGANDVIQHLTSQFRR